MSRYQYFDRSLQTLADGNSIQWKQSYNWGDHSLSGYLTGLIDDPNPQLGADLNLNSYNISGSGNISGISSIYFNTNIADIDQIPGQINWNNEAGTIDLGLTQDVRIHIGQSVLYRVKNSTNDTILKGQSVSVTGVLGGGEILQISPFCVDNTIDEIRFIGLALEDIADGDDGFVVHFGHIKNVDLRSTNTDLNPNGETWEEGDILYVHDISSGGLTKTPPKDNIYVAMVLSEGNNGELFVRITNPGHLTDNHDVNITGATNGQFLQYNSATDYWIPSSSGNFTELYVNDILIPTGVGNVGHIAYWDTSNSISSDSGQLYWDTNNNRLGVGTTSPDYKLQVNGSFGATTKSFRINHPSKSNYTLEYGSLESPYHGVRLTGRGVVKKGFSVVSLPSYIKDLIHDDETINIQLTNLKHDKILYISKIDINNNMFEIKAKRAKTLGELHFFWTLTGIRKDVPILETEKKK